MRRPLLTTLTALVVAAVTAVATAVPATAIAITAGFMITSGGRWCTVSFPDPVHPAIVYTAGHCYQDSVREVNLGRIQIGQFIPEIYSPNIDLIAIRLYANMPSEYTLMSREPLLNPWVPHEGATVCKYGATTQESCGKVLSVNADKSRFTVKIKADHGDSGAPVYEPDDPNDHDGVHPVGVIVSEQSDDPTVINCSSMVAIEAFLEETWGSSWKMD
jgi:hypothetical protein